MGEGGREEANERELRVHQPIAKLEAEAKAVTVEGGRQKPMARAKATSIKLSQFPHFEDSVAQNVVVCFSAEAFYIISISAEFFYPHSSCSSSLASYVCGPGSALLCSPSRLAQIRKFSHH